MSRGRVSQRRRIAVVTGTRAEYGLLTSPMRAIADHPRLELQLVVTGMHLLREFGNTVREIERDGWPIAARVRMQRGDDDPLDQADGLGRGMRGIAEFLHASSADVVLVLGDRIEAMAGALAAVTTGRILAHIHGGDVAPGDFDDSLRHSISKLAHVHLAATRGAARRLVRMGEQPERVHVVGAPGLDRLGEILHARKRAGAARSERVGARRALIVFHPCGRPARDEQRDMQRILNAAARHKLHQTIVYPNTDRGHKGIVAAIEAHAKRFDREMVDVRRSLPRDAYLRRLIEADVLIGNTSSGLIEAPLAGTPVVNVGLRQAGREAGGRCVLACDAAPAALYQTIAAALRKRPRAGSRTVYGDGQAGRRIAEVLAHLPNKASLARKVIRY